MNTNEIFIDTTNNDNLVKNDGNNTNNEGLDNSFYDIVNFNKKIK